jgi:hypothetical protein
MAVELEVNHKPIQRLMRVLAIRGFVPQTEPEPTGH